jgi:hypothetical protein
MVGATILSPSLWGKYVFCWEVAHRGTWLGLLFCPFFQKKVLFSPSLFFKIHFIVEKMKMCENDQTLDLWFESRDLITKISFPWKYRVQKIIKMLIIFQI